MKKIEVNFDKSCEISEIKADPNDKERKINWGNSESWLLHSLEEPKSPSKFKKISLEDSSLLGLGSSIKSGKIKLSSHASLTIDFDAKELRENPEEKIEKKPQRKSEKKVPKKTRRSSYRKSFAKEEDSRSVIDKNESSILKRGTKIKKSEKKPRIKSSFTKETREKSTPKKSALRNRGNSSMVRVSLHRNRYRHTRLIPTNIGQLIDSPVVIGPLINVNGDLLSTISGKDRIYFRSFFGDKNGALPDIIEEEFAHYQNNPNEFVGCVIRNSGYINQILNESIWECFRTKNLDAFICYKIIKAWATAYAKYGLKSGRDVLEPWQNISVLAHDYMRDYMEDVENYKRVNNIN